MARTESEAGPRELDWSTAEVRDGDLVVELTGERASAWEESFRWVVERLGRGSNQWGEVALEKTRVRVRDVAPGAEADLRHFLESAVLQANADHAPPEQDPRDEDDDRGEESPERDADAQMTETFRGFDQAERRDEGEQRDAAERRDR